jgi:WD40 repeat protein/serine/threonine protein kinase
MAPQPVDMIERHPLAVLAALLCETATRTDDGTSIGIRVVLHGSGGCGKTMLAQALCWHERVQQAYPDGILWATMGEHTNEARRLAVLLDLIEWWSGEGRPRFTDVSTAGAELRQRLAGRRVLVVVDDVGHGADLEPFLGLGGAASLLVTTRDHRTLPGDFARHEVDAMTADESVALLGAGLTSAPQELAKLAARLQHWPILLDLVNCQIHEHVRRRELGVSDAIVEVERSLDEQGLTIDTVDDDARRAAVARTMAVILERLGEDERQRYEHLAVFPGDTEIPLSVLERYWALGSAETRKLCARLHALSLLRSFDLALRTIRLHGVFRRYLVDGAGEALPTLHTRWLERFRPTSGRWSELPADEPHAWRFLAWHLRQAGRADELARLLLDFDWLDAKLRAAGVTELLADFEHMPSAHEAEPEVQLVRDTLRLSSQVLAADPTQLPGQLLGRLGDRPDAAAETVDAGARRRVAGLLAQAHGVRRHPWLRPRIASLLPPGGSMLRTLTGHDGRIRAVAITADGARAISAAADGTLKLWDLEQGTELLTLAGHAAAIRAVAITAEGACAISASDDATLKVWDLARGGEVLTLAGHEAAIRAMACTSDGRRAVSGSLDGILKLWDLERGIELCSLAAHDRKIRAVAVTADGTRALSSAEDGALKLWDLERGAELSTMVGHEAWVNAAALTPDGKRAISASSDRTVKVWDLERGALLRTLAGHESWVWSVAVTADGARVISASKDRTLKLWDLEQGAELRTLAGHDFWVWAVAVTADGKRAISASRDRTLKLWDLEQGAELRTLTGQTSWVNAVAVTADERRVVSVYQDRALKLWDLEQGVELGSLGGRGAQANAVAVIGEGQRAIYASRDRALELWDLEHGTRLGTLTGHDAAVNAVAVTADGTRAVSASDDRTLKIWSLARGTEVGTLAGHEAAVTAVALTRDGTRAVSGSRDRSVKIWDLERCTALATLTGHGAAVWAVAVTLDGSHAVSAADDWTIKLWDLARGVALRTIAAHEHWITAVALTPDGKCALSASRDRTLKLWDLATGALLATFTADGAIRTCTVSPSGRVFVAGDTHGQVHFLDLVEPSERVTTIEAFAATIEEPPRDGHTMTRKRRVEEIFDAALDVAPEERAAFLARACAGNDELRWEVEELLEVEREQTFGLLPSGELPMGSVLGDLHPSLKELSLAPGMQLGRYELLRSLGQGGMGTVFLAHDKRLHRRVAIKFLHAATPDMTERFLAEARNTARCKHENIVVIHDVDELGGRPYMVLELLEGEPLRQRLAGLADSGEITTRNVRLRDAAPVPGLAVPEVLALVIPVVRALVCAHAQGIVHRDLKPENVFLCGNGTVKVLDFGIAKALVDLRSSVSLAVSTLTLLTQDHVVTEQGALLGTLPYMSPEQWGIDEIDERTDLWAVGIMLYEMLAGQHPLAPLSYGKMQTQVPDLDLPMPDIGSVMPGLGKLAGVVDACLRKRKAERIPSAEALLAALEAVRVEQTLEAVRVELSPVATDAARTGTPTGPQAALSEPEPPARESRELAAPPVAAPPPQAHKPSASWLAASASWLATLALLAFWPRFAIPSFSGPSGGIVLALGARAGDALRGAHGALCASMRAIDAEATRCIELPRIGVGSRELREAATTAGASLVVWLDEDHGLRLLPANTSAELLSELPTLDGELAEIQPHLAGILHPLGRALAGDVRADGLRAPPVGSDAVGWRLAALAWYLNVLAHNQQAIPVADLQRTMTHCRDEVSLADTSCALVHYVHARLDPAPPDARVWLERLLTHGPPSFADPIAIELAGDDCMHEPARLQAALLHLAGRWAQESCRRLTLAGPARCLLDRYPQASPALQPIAHPGTELEARCEAGPHASSPSERSSSDETSEHR